MRPARHGFTLIELVVVMAIIAVLVGMLMPLLALSRRYAERTNTESLLRKVDTALRLFRSDARVYPWDACLQPRQLPDGSANPDFNNQAGIYPDVAAASPAWSNRLYRHLGAALAPAARDAVLADAAAARAAFAYDLTNPDGRIASPLQEVAGRYGVQTFLASDRLPYGFAYSGGWQPKWNDQTALPAVLNRMAQEHYALAMLAGAASITGPEVRTVTSPSGASYASANPNAAVRRTAKVVPAAASAADPGWGDDYLEGELEPRHRQGESIVDVWGRPLLYLCRVLPGSEAAGGSRPFNRTAVTYIDETLYGLGAVGRRPLQPYDAVRQQALAADPPWLPDPAAPLRSDRRAYAAAPFAFEFEVWSAGADGRSAWMRDDPLVRDDVAARDYAAGLR